MQSSLDENSDGTGHMEEIPGSPILSWDSTNSNDFSEIPRVFPRIGNKYQANVSTFKPQVDCHQLGTTDSMKCKGNYDEEIEQRFAEGLAVPVVQIRCFPPLVGINKCPVTDMNGLISNNEIATVQRESGLHRQDLVQSVDEGCAHELSDSHEPTDANINSSITDWKTEISRADDSCVYSTLSAENMLDAFCSHRGHKRKKGRLAWKKVKKIKIDLLDLQIQHPRIYGSGKDANSGSYVIVPGSPSAPWSKSDEDLFLLGLYIFGKNFNAVKRFVETKEMGDILSYYYGVFFRTESYCRWAESRKPRSRKRIQGPQIVSGWRQQELLMRLLPHIPDLFKHEVPEKTKAFNEGRTSTEEFVTKLKSLAGPDVFFHAVGIGDRTQDLTSAHIEPAKTGRVLSSRHEVPVGRACSSLSTEDIVQFLTGDIRISKARADDLFWEAVWPRLLARGWQSEQPADQVPFGLRQSLVFLIPGVEKFSRRNLTKGIHYFDSVSEVLSRVASDPSLLELDSDGMTGVEGKPEHLWASESMVVGSGHAGLPHCYLQPRISTNTSDSLVFTIVDTSLILQGEQPHKIRERVTLPLDDDSEKLQTIYWETENEDNLEAHLTEEQCCKSSVVGDSLIGNSEKSTHIVINNENSPKKTGIVGTPKSPAFDQNNALSSPSRQMSLSTCYDCNDDTVDANLTEPGGLRVQRAILNICSTNATSEAPCANTSESGIPIFSLTQDSPKGSIGNTFLSKDLLSANNVSYSSNNSRECTVISQMELCSKLLQHQPENTAVNSILVMHSELMDGSKNEDNSHYQSGSECLDEETNKISQVAQALNSGPEEIPSLEPQENIASALPDNVLPVRRQSTRVRPLTARALEAFASGFFSPKRRKKIGHNTLNSDGYRTKSLSRLIQDELTS